MEFKFVILFLATWVLAYAMAASVTPEEKTDDVQEEEEDSSPAESLSLLSAIAPPPGSSSQDTFLDDVNYPYAGPQESLYGFAAPQPSFGISINTKALLAPQIEVLRLVEAFINLKSELLVRFQSLVNDNYDLIRSILNFVIGKLTKVHTFLLKGISVIRKILEFALTVFADWNITLPSITLGGTYSNDVQPHGVYGLPQLAAAMGK